MSACGGSDQDEQSEDGDLGLGRGCQPGSLPPLQILRRPRLLNTQQRRQQSSAFRDHDESEIVKRPSNPVVKLTTKLGFYSKPKSLSADSKLHGQPECDTVVLGTPLMPQKLVFRQGVMDIRHRRSVGLQNIGTLGTVYYIYIAFSLLSTVMIH